MYVFKILDTFAAGTSIVFTVLCQVVAVAWFYGKFSNMTFKTDLCFTSGHISWSACRRVSCFLHPVHCKSWNASTWTRLFVLFYIIYCCIYKADIEWTLLFSLFTSITIYNALRYRITQRLQLYSSADSLLLFGLKTFVFNYYISY